MLWKLLQEGLTPEEGDEPTHFAVIFDHSAQDLPQRHLSRIQGAAPGAAGRPDPAIRADPRGDAGLFLHCIEQEGFEADDLIATYARQAAGPGARVTIVSSDKDLMQLVGPRIGMIDTMKNKIFGVAGGASRNSASVRRR
jgi:DNA polymerase-1